MWKIRPQTSGATFKRTTFIFPKIKLKVTQRKSMRFLVVCSVVTSFYFTDAMPFNDCRDHYELCGKWAKHQYCEMTDYKDYMTLVCPYSCGRCDDILGDLGASGKGASGSGGGQKVIPEVAADFENFKRLGGSTAKFDKESEDIDGSSSFESLSGSGESKMEPLFRESNSKETENQSHGETAQQDEPDDEQKSISGSSADSTSANFWRVVRTEPDAEDRGGDRELHLIRRFEVPTPALYKRASNEDRSATNKELTSGEQLAHRGDAPSASGSGEDLSSGEDDAPFDTSSADSESDSGCSSGYGCYSSEGAQGGDGGSINSRSVISQAEERAAASGGTSGDFAPIKNAWVQTQRDAAAGPYDDVASGSASEGSGSELRDTRLEITFAENGSGFGKEGAQPETDSHEIEDAIFESGIPLDLTRDINSSSGSGSGIPSPSPIESFHSSETSASGSGEAEKAESMQLFVAPQHHKRIGLMEKMMKLGKLQAIKITHHSVGASSRNEVPRVKYDNSQMLSDLGKGRKVSFVLNQDFHSEYANEYSAAYNILANSVKQEVEKALGSEAVVSEITFSEVREPIAHSPRFSKVMVSFKLLGDVSKLEKKVKKGMINGLVVDKTFFHDAP